MSPKVFPRWAEIEIQQQESVVANAVLILSAESTTIRVVCPTSVEVVRRKLALEKWIQIDIIVYSQVRCARYLIAILRKTHIFPNIVVCSTGTPRISHYTGAQPGPNDHHDSLREWLLRPIGRLGFLLSGCFSSRATLRLPNSPASLCPRLHLTRVLLSG
jgi:hypothetical protein